MLTNVLESEMMRCDGAGTDSLNVAPVDFKHLRRYTLGDAKLEREVLDLFLMQLPETIRALGSAHSEKDWRVAAHTIKGSARAVGAWRIARLAEHAERHLSVQNPGHCAEAVARIEEATDEARQFIRASYPQAC